MLLTTLQKYVIKEFLRGFAMITLVLSLILLTGLMVRHLHKGLDFLIVLRLFPIMIVFVLQFGQATESLFAVLTSSSKSPRHFEHVYSKIGISIFL